ncbi:MAG: GIY-YIG nuclease family protein [bacterium]|nr:GIY-YIG nuclease family protein [bacterium]
MYFVYLAQCKDQSIYTGITNDLSRRLKQHQNKKGGYYTRSHQIEKIVHTESYNTKSEALKRETEIKSWRREKKLKLIQKQSDVRFQVPQPIRNS